ncbi:unnamed protein product [Prorocentrum cordatum]|uniref:protein-serine/threonine phosphatase n=1 Tax=Prorocentrum cordatum TaxID=2364126 RepID=A0ABN9UN65_9DINO|nr:unnamed protein product [Polarella glacialis]
MSGPLVREVVETTALARSRRAKRLGLYTIVRGSENEMVQFDDHLTPGGIACAMSHRDALRRVATHPTAAWGLVLEDDIAAVVPDADRVVARILRALPHDWSAVFLGYHHKDGCPHPRARGPEGRSAREAPQGSDEEVVGARVFEIHDHVWGLYAWMVRKEAAQELVDGLFPIRGQVDYAISSWLVRNRGGVYCVHPDELLFYSPPSEEGQDSDIQTMVYEEKVVEQHGSWESYMRQLRPWDYEFVFMVVLFFRTSSRDLCVDAAALQRLEAAEAGSGGHGVRFRPHVRPFLQWALEHFDLYLYTHGTTAYATEVVGRLDPDRAFFGVPARLFTRDNTPQGLKDLREIFPHDPSRALVVDDRDEVWCPEVRKGQLVRVSPFLSFRGDPREGVSLEGSAAAGQREQPAAKRPRPALTDGAGSEQGGPGPQQLELGWPPGAAGPDAQLLFLMPMLRAVHEAAFAGAPSRPRPLAEVLPAIRRRALRGCTVCLTGVGGDEGEAVGHALAWWCRALGAQVEAQLSPRTTHLVAARRDTPRYQDRGGAGEAGRRGPADRAPRLGAARRGDVAEAPGGLLPAPALWGLARLPRHLGGAQKLRQRRVSQPRQAFSERRGAPLARCSAL